MTKNQTKNLLALLYASLIFTAFSINLASAIPQLKAAVKTEKIAYIFREEVDIYGNVTFNGVLVGKGLVAIQVNNALGTLLTRTRPLGPIGNQTFDIEILETTLCDQFGNPRTTIVRGNTAYFKIKILNKAFFSKTVTVTGTIYDNNTTPIGHIVANTEVYGGATFEFAQSFYIDHWVANGTGTIYANAFSNLPSGYGYPYCPEKAATFAILESTYDETQPTGTPQQPVTPNGTFNTKFKLSPDPTKGTHLIYATAVYEGYTTQQPAITTFQVTDTADFGSKDPTTTITSNCQNRMEGSIFTPDKTGTVYVVGAYIRMTGGNIKAAIYRASDGKLIAYSNSKPGPTSGVWTWIFISLDYQGNVIAGTPYLIAIWSDSSCQIGGKTDPTNPGRYKTQTYGNWPNPITGLTTDNHLHSIYATFKVRAPPRASFVIQPPRAAPSYTIRFDASPATPEGYNDTITSYKWNFGDGKNATGKIVYYSYPTENNYTVTLNVTDNEGFWNTTTRIAIVKIIRNIAITEISTLNDVYNDWIVDVNVKIKNKGTVAATFNVTLYANTTYGGRITVTNLAPYATTNRIIAWNTTGLVPLKNYTIQAVADTLIGETETADNTMQFGPIFTRMMGDTRFDRKIDILDIVVVSSIYGATPTAPNWNIMADLRRDNKIDIIDIVKITSKYGARY